jgi:hypothetical protein
MRGRLSSLLGLAALRSEIDAIVGRVRFLVILLGLGAVFWLLAIGYAIAALTLWLVGLVGGVAAALILTVVFAAAGLATHAIAVNTKRSSTPLSPAMASALAPPARPPAEESDAGLKVVEVTAGDPPRRRRRAPVKRPPASG